MTAARARVPSRRALALALTLVLGALAPGGAGRTQVATEPPDAAADDRKGRETAERLGLDLSSEAPLQINADRQTLSESPNGGRISVWEGDVELRQGDLVLQSQKLLISFASEDVGGAVERIEAEGEVDIVQGDIQLRCDRAVYEDQSCRAVCERRDACAQGRALTSPAVLRQGEDVVRGGRIEFDVCSGDFEVSCGASGYFQPRQGRANRAGGTAGNRGAGSAQ